MTRTCDAARSTRAGHLCTAAAAPRNGRPAGPRRAGSARAKRPHQSPPNATENHGHRAHEHVRHPATEAGPTPWPRSSQYQHRRAAPGSARRCAASFSRRRFLPGPAGALPGLPDTGPAVQPVHGRTVPSPRLSRSQPRAGDQPSRPGQSSWRTSASGHPLIPAGS